MLFFQRLGPDAVDVSTEGHRRRTEVAAVFRLATASFAPQIGQLVQVVIHRRRAAIHDQLISLELPQQFIHQHKREPDVVSDVASHQITAGQEQFQNQRFDFAFGQTDFGNDCGSRGTNTSASASDGRSTSSPSPEPSADLGMALRQAADPLQQTIKLLVCIAVPVGSCFMGRRRGRQGFPGIVLLLSAAVLANES